MVTKTSSSSSSSSIDVWDPKTCRLWKSPDATLVFVIAMLSCFANISARHVDETALLPIADDVPKTWGPVNHETNTHGTETSSSVEKSRIPSETLPSVFLGHTPVKQTFTEESKTDELSKSATSHRAKNRQRKSHTKRRHRKRRHNSESSSGHILGIRRQSCPTVSEYMELQHAEDMYGNMVDVSPTISVGGVVIKQYFYQSVCAKERCACRGVDETVYSSSCETNYTFTYANIVMNGETGWRHIRVPAGCKCVVRRIHPGQLLNVMDYIN